MATKAKIYGLSGEYGWTFSSGFSAYLDTLAKTYEVQKVADSGKNLDAICTDIIGQPPRPIILLGYSLGANGCAWVQQALTSFSKPRKIALIVGFDPTRNGPPLTGYPIGKNVSRCLCFQQTAWWFPTSLFFGRGVYSRATNGPQIEITQVQEDHLWVQSDRNLQAICTKAIQRAVG